MYTPLGKFLQISQGALLNAGLLRGGVITSQELIIAGGTNGVIRSQNFDPTNELGWAVFGDGSASFYGDVFFGENAIFQGDLYSSNWDGTIPLNLSSVDTGATAGFALDSSVGAVQFMGDVFIGSSLTFFGGNTLDVDDLPTMFAVRNNVADWSLWILGPNDTGIGTTNPSSIELWGAQGDSNGIAFYGENRFAFMGGADLIVGSSTGMALIEPTAGSASAPTYSFLGDTDTGMYRSGSNELSFSVDGSMKLQLAPGRVDINDALRILDGSAANPAIRFSADTNTGIYRFGTDAVGVSAGGRANLVVGGSGAHVGAGGTHTSGGSGLFVWDLLKDIGNHEVLRADRGAGTGTTEVGYFSSWEYDPHTGERRKDDIVSLAESPRWNRDWFYKIRSVDFRRLSTGEREFGFLLDEWKATDDNMKYLTTKGDKWGYAPHDTAVLAAAVLEIQEQQKLIERLQEKVAKLEEKCLA